MKHKMEKSSTSEADPIFGDDFEFPHGAHAHHRAHHRAHGHPHGHGYPHAHAHAHAHANARAHAHANAHANVLDMPIHMRTPMYHHSSASDAHDMHALTGLHPGRHRHALRGDRHYMSEPELYMPDPHAFHKPAMSAEHASVAQKLARQRLLQEQQAKLQQLRLS